MPTAPSGLVGYASAVGTGTSISVTKTAVQAALGGTVLDGDTLLGIQSGDDGTFTQFSASTGTWSTFLSQDTGSNSAGIKMKVYTRTAASEPASWSFANTTTSGLSDGVVTVVVVRGMKLSAILGSMQSTAASTSRVTPSVTHAGTAGSIMLAGASVNGPGATNTWTAPTDMVKIADAQSTTWTSHAVGILGSSPPTPTGTKTFTCTATQTAVGLQWALVLPPTFPPTAFLPFFTA